MKMFVHRSFCIIHECGGRFSKNVVEKVEICQIYRQMSWHGEKTHPTCCLVDQSSKRQTIKCFNCLYDHKSLLGEGAGLGWVELRHAGLVWGRLDWAGLGGARWSFQKLRIQKKTEDSFDTVWQLVEGKGEAYKLES